MLHIAICLSGHVRENKFCYPYLIKNILEPNKQHNIDFFISTWQYIDTTNVIHPNANKAGQLTDINLLNQQYQPKLLTVEQVTNHPYDFTKYENRKSPTNSVNAVYNMCYKIWQANELKKQWEKNNNFKYDVVMRLRFDVAIPQPIYFDELDLSSFYTEAAPIPKDWVSDKVGISSSAIMDTYSSIYFNLDKIWEDGCLFLPEMMFKKYLDDNKINIKFLPFEVIFPRYNVWEYHWQNPNSQY